MTSFYILYVIYSIIQECWKFEKPKAKFDLTFRLSKLIVAAKILVLHINIALKNPKMILISWYAHIWHKIHIFHLPVKCAWWVISNQAPKFRHATLYMFQCVLTELLCILYLRCCFFTTQNFSPFEFWKSVFLVCKSP